MSTLAVPGTLSSSLESATLLHWLATRTPPSSPRDNETDHRTLEALALVVTSGALAAYLEARSQTDLTDHRDLAWLALVEDLALASQALAHLPAADWTATLARVLTTTLQQARTLLASGPFWPHARRAETRCAELGPVLPWSDIRPGVETGALTGSAATEETFEAWSAGQLHPRDEQHLTSLVRNDDSWRKAYLAFLSSVSTLSLVPAEDGTGTVLLHVPQPHLGPHVAMHVTQQGREVLWELRGLDPARSQRLGLGADAIRWDDPVLGPRSLALVHLTLSPLEQTVQDLNQLEQMRRQTGVGEGCAVVSRRLAESLREGALRHSIEQAAAAFERGDPDEVNTRWAALGLRARLLLDEAIYRLGPAGYDLFGLVSDADETLRDQGGALHLIPEPEYRTMVDAFGTDLETGAWWGTRQCIEREMPTWKLLDQLEKLSRKQTRQPIKATSTLLRTHPPLAMAAATVPGVSTSTTAALERLLDRQSTVGGVALDEALKHLLQTPCPWLDSRIASLVLDLQRQAHPATEQLERLTQPRPGRAPLLLVGDEGRRGVLAEVRVWCEPRQGPWPFLSRLNREASESVLRAFHGVARQMPGALPRFPFEEHALDVLLPDGQQPLFEGGSLALSVALAFASLWLEQPVSAAIVTSAGLRDDGERLSSVAHVDVKAQALSARSPLQPVRLLVHPANEQDAQTDAITTLGVTTLSAALREVGLDVTAASFAPELGDTEQRQDQLRKLQGMVQTQNIDPFRNLGVDPWLLVAMQMRLLLESLKSSGAPGFDLASAHTLTALAFTHAGEPRQALQLLEASDMTSQPPAIRAHGLIAQLGAATDTGDFARCEQLCNELTACLPQLPDWDAHVRGAALGAMGRSRLLQRDTDRALPLLEAALAEHALRVPKQVPRSRVGLAMGLRVAGRLHEALTQLETAEGELQGKLALDYPAFAKTTRMFLAYERARVLVLLDRAREAQSTALRALETARTQGFWPAVGIVRVLVWASRALGETRQTERFMDELAQLAATAPQPARAFVDRLVQEASGLPTSDGELE